MATVLMEGTWSLYLITIAIYDAISVAEARSTGPLPPFRFCSLQYSGFAFTATENNCIIPLKNCTNQSSANYVPITGKLPITLSSADFSAVSAWRRTSLAPERLYEMALVEESDFYGDLGD